MIIQPTQDKKLYLAKKGLENKLTYKIDEAEHTQYLTPPVNPETSTYFYDNNSKLSKSSRILAEDIILNNINIDYKHKNNDYNILKKEDLKFIKDKIKDNQIELYYTLIDYFTYGYGACELIKEDINTNKKKEEEKEDYMDDSVNDDLDINAFKINRTTFKLSQIPAITLKIIKNKYKDNSSFYIAEQNIKGNKIWMKIIGEKYPSKLTHYKGEKLGECLWIGGDNFYEFYSKPYWLPNKEHIISKISLNKLNSEKITNGNITPGILHFNHQETFQTANNDLDTGDIIKEELDQAGSGLALLYTTSENPIKMEYINITDNNYDYLSKLAREADDEVLSSYSIPRERLMINDQNESQNSHKSATIWRIYLKYLNVQQLPFEKEIQKLLKHIYNIKFDIDLEVPLFSDDKKDETELIIKLYNNGLITLKQALENLSPFIKLDINIDLLENPLYNMRFYNGQPLNNYTLNPEEEKELEYINSQLGEI